MRQAGCIYVSGSARSCATSTGVVWMRIFPPRLSWLGLMLAVLVAGCAAGRGGSIPYATEAMPLPDAPSAVVIPADSKLTPGDLLAITVFQAEPLSKDYRIDRAGNIAMPLIGTVSAVGRTVPELRDDIARRLGERYMNNPDVSISVKESSNRLFTVEGSVRQPGMFEVPGPMTLVQAIAVARGTDENANPRRVGIFRTVQGQRVAAAFDLTSIRRGEEPDPQVYAGDIIVVDGSPTRSTLTTVLQTLPILALFRPY